MPTCYSSGAEWVQFVANLAQIGGLGVAIWAIGYARKQLDSWREQVRRASEHEAAIRCRTAASMLEDAICMVRGSKRLKNGVLQLTEEDLKRYVEDYIELVNPREMALREALVAAEVYWGKELEEKFAPFVRVSLAVLESAYKATRIVRGDGDPADLEVAADVLFESDRPGKTDLISQQLKFGLADFDTFLRTKLVSMSG